MAAQEAAPLDAKYKAIQLPNNILVHRYPTCVAIYGLGKKLTMEDCGKNYVRLAPLDNRASPDWTHVPAPTDQSSRDKSLLLLGVTEDKLTFMKEGVCNQWLEFDNANDGNWAPTYEHLGFIKKHLYDIING